MRAFSYEEIVKKTRVTESTYLKDDQKMYQTF